MFNKIKIKKKLKISFRNQGFTLIELMVSLSILIIVILTAMSIYVRVIGTRQKSLGQLNLQQDGQYIMSLIVKDIRAGTIDYSNYGSGQDCGEINITTTKVEVSSGHGPELCVLDFDSTTNQIRYKRDVDGTRGTLKRCKNTDCSNSSNYQTITMTNISIEHLDFYISPTSNPFVAGSTSYYHPRATIVLKLKSLIEKTGEKQLTIQQTVPQRYELRK